MRALCVAGGGQAGARSGGQIYRNYKSYRLLVGTSIGAWIASLHGRPEHLKEAGTTTRNKDIWKIRGVNKKDAPNWPVFIARIIGGRKSWGDSSRLLDLIKKHYTIEDHNAYIQHKIKISVCVWNSTKERIEYHSNLVHTYYPNFCKYICASMSAPPFMNIITDPLTGDHLEDGGVNEVLPLEYTVQESVKLGIKEIDAYVHDTKNNLYGVSNKKPVKNGIHRSMRAQKNLMRDALRSDIKLGLKAAKKAGIRVNLYYLPEGDIKPRFYFMPKLQREWFNRPDYKPEIHEA